MRVAFFTQHGRPQVPCVVAQDVQTRVAGLQPSREQVDGQWKAIHLDKQGHDECRERAEAAPVARGGGFEETVGKHDKDGRIENDQTPQAVRLCVVVHDGSPRLGVF